MNTFVSSTAASASKASRATAAMFLSVFGGLWLMFWAHEKFRLPTIEYTLICIATLVYFAASFLVYKTNRPALKAQSGTLESRKRSRIFRLINVLQWFIIVVVANILTNFGLTRWIIPAVMLVVGIHFIPLAKLFVYPPHYITGALLVLLSVGYPLVSVGGPSNAVGWLDTGLVLWASGAWSLTRSYS